MRLWKCGSGVGSAGQSGGRGWRSVWREWSEGIGERKIADRRCADRSAEIGFELIGRVGLSPYLISPANIAPMSRRCCCSAAPGRSKRSRAAQASLALA